MRALVKETLSREHVDTLASDIEEACNTLAKKGGAHRVGADEDRHRPRSLSALPPPTDLTEDDDDRADL